MSNINSVFYAESYHPIQAGSIDGTDILPHDNAVYRAHLCSKANLYDPFGDPKVIGDPYCTLFVGRLSEQTDEESLRKAMSKFGRVKNLRLVRHIVTGASRGYAFVEYETDREMRRAYEDAHHSIIDGSEVIVDYNRQQLMPGWIPRRLGGGLGGKKESGQLRFGGQERPFRAPLRPIPYDELKILGIPAPPEGRYMSRFKIPSPPRRRSSHTSRENLPSRHRTPDDDSSSSHTIRDDSTSMHRRSDDRRSTHTIKADSRSPSRHRKPERERNSYVGTEDSSSKHRRLEENEHRQRHRRTPSERDETYYEQERHHKEHSDRYYKERSSTKEYSPHHKDHPDRYYKEMSSTREYKPDRKKHSDQHYKESSLSREYSQHHEEHSDRYYKERSSTREYSPHRHKRKRSRSRDIRGRDQEVENRY